MNNTIGFIPANIVAAFAKLGAASILQDYVKRAALFSLTEYRSSPTTFTFFMDANGEEIGSYDRINQVGIINVRPRKWHDSFKEGCTIIPIPEDMR